MCLVSAIRVAFKQALRSGRVYKQQLRLPHNPTLDPPLGLVTSPEFSELVHPLSEQQWSAFQAKERGFRSSLVGEEDRRENHRYVCSADPGSWNRLIKLLIGTFFDSGIFKSVSHQGIPFSFPLLKFVARVLRKLPTVRSLPEPLTPELAGRWIEAQLCFLRDSVQPSLSASSRQQHQRRKVSRDRLSYLWQHKQSDAIRIILNNSEFPDPLRVWIIVRKCSYIIRINAVGDH